MAARTSRIRIARMVLISGVIAMSPVLGQSVEPDRSVVELYTGPSPFVEPVCYMTEAVAPIFDRAIGEHPDFSPAARVGGACLGVRSGERSVEVLLDDDAGWIVAGTVYFKDAAGDYIHDAQFMLCGGGTVAIPQGAASMIVAAEASAIWCIPDVFPAERGPATTGRITATFSHA